MLQKTEQLQQKLSRHWSCVNWGVIDNHCEVEMTAWQYNKHLQTTTWRILAQLVDWQQRHNTAAVVLWLHFLQEKKSDKAKFVKYSISDRLGNNQERLMVLDVNPFYTLWEILF